MAQGYEFVVPQGSFIEAEETELVGLYLLAKIKKIAQIDDHGHYTDHGLIVM